MNILTGGGGKQVLKDSTVLNYTPGAIILESNTSGNTIRLDRAGQRQR